jgi:hypothetical protein
LDFTDHVGRYFARQYGMSPMNGRVLGWLLICDPPQQTAAEIATALQASRSAIGAAVNALSNPGLVQRTRAPGERADRISAHYALGAQSLDDPTEYVALGALARRGLEILSDAAPTRRARLLELAAFADFLAERSPALAAEWRERRDQLRAAGELPDPPDRRTQES